MSINTIIALTLGVIDMQDGGLFRIVGSVKNTPDVPVFRRVRLHDQTSGRLIREVWSDPATGAYAFNGIADGLYYVTGFDHTNQFAAGIESDITPTVPT